MDARDKIIEDLQKLVASLTARVAELELALAKATKDSSTSSKPPSSDITKPKTTKKPGRRGKPKRGGQPGICSICGKISRRNASMKHSTMNFPTKTSSGSN